MKVLMVLTSHGEMGISGEKTGFWLEEFVAPYYVLQDAGVEITLSSPKGGQPPIDPRSEADNAKTSYTQRFFNDTSLKLKLSQTHELKEMVAEFYDGLFYPGGHGPLWDLSADVHSISIIQAFNDQGKPIAFVCHSPAALLNVETPSGDPLLKDRKVTGFSNTEEGGVKLTSIVPFLLEDALIKKGAHYSKTTNWEEYVIKDGNLITGQNPASSAKAAKVLLETIYENKVHSVPYI
ncbi:MAG: type 1 glutamine amidotransferase domain-containing protein [Ferruginibacter sp.]